ncbi:hypothetical protein HUT16_16090 [Kitasatospora sp. NA04385]|uniref:hypothetical protein n=1 Tax=Kitasatospora sp. NA04385 TaxID=2742135 RepID=UPI001592A6C3|nr:hypothetical protein [Kitasatospora sp. NA04385]QKW20384.1 hypothetical protein HUT16_16090 [Kitasatospora sp. NA04385]
MPGAGEWDGLFEGIEEVAARPGMAWTWISGLCWHPALDVRVRLAAVEPTLVGYSDRMHPPEVVDAAVAQSDWKIRRAWAEHQRGMSVAQWVRLIGDEPAGWRRNTLLYRASCHAPRPTAEDFAGWTADPDPKVRLRALYFRGLPEPVAAALVVDPDPEVRALLCERGWERLDAHSRAALAADPDPEVQAAAGAHAGHELTISRAEFDALDQGEQWDAASVRHFDEDCLRHLLDHPDKGVRLHLAENELLTPDTLAVLARDPEPTVRSRVAVRPDATEELRAEIEPGLPTRLPSWWMHWVEDQHGDPAAMRQLAASASTRVREAVAGARTLPPDVLDLLSRDPATSVRYALVHHNEAPPAELLLEAALNWTDPWPVLRRPDFPREALNGLADHPDPKRRRLALYAADCTPETVERLATDPDPMVHAPAAADPRLSPATALRLLATTEADYRAAQETPGLPVPATYGLRNAVIHNPQLPVPTLTTLLRDQGSAQDAAANPAIPATVAHRLIDLATHHR